MALKLDTLQNHVARLRRSLKRFPKDPPPEAVHRLRAQISLVEAITPALLEDRAADGRRLLRPLLQVRKAAGKVRDADVFADLIRLLPSGSDAECLVILSKYLCRRRAKTAAKLHDTLAEKREDCLHSLKQYSKLTGKQPNSPETALGKQQAPIAPAALARKLITELSSWPRTRRDDLHSYRIRVKRLRYLLQSSADNDPEFLKRLAVVKDAIGEWHDWSELATIAARRLEHGPSCPILAHVRRIARSKLRRAISLTTDMRQTCFGAAPTAKKG